MPSNSRTFSPGFCERRRPTYTLSCARLQTEFPRVSYYLLAHDGRSLSLPHLTPELIVPTPRGGIAAENGRLLQNTNREPPKPSPSLRVTGKRRKRLSYAAPGSSIPKMPASHR